MNVPAVQAAGTGIVGTVSSGSGPVEGIGVQAYPIGSNALAGQAITDAYGDYELTLSPGDYRITTCANCFAGVPFADSEQSPVSVVSGFTTTVDFTLGSAFTLQGVLSDSSTGLGIPYAHIQVEDVGNFQMQAITMADSLGGYHLYLKPNSTYRLTTVVSQYGGYTYVDQFYNHVSSPDQFTPYVTGNAGAIQTIDFALEPASVVTGTVRDQRGNPVGGVHVAAHNPANQDLIVPSNITSPEGAYRLLLPAGTFLIYPSLDWNGAAYAFDQADGQTLTLASSSIQNGVDFVLEDPAVIGGHVQDDQGSPLANVPVNVSNFDTRQYISGTQTDSNGDYRFYVKAGQNYRVGTSINSQGRPYLDKLFNNTYEFDWATPIHPANPGDVLAASFILERAAIVTGQVTSAGLPLSNIPVRLEYCGSGNAISNINTDNSGHFTVYALPGQSFQIQTHSGWNNLPYVDQIYRDQDQNQCFTLANPGDTMGGVQIELPQAASIHGHVADQDGNPIANLTIIVEDFNTYQYYGGSSTDSNGDYSLSIRPGQSYRLKTCASCNLMPYLDRVFDNTENWDLAQPLLAANGGDVLTANFTLTHGAVVQGIVQDAQGNPISNVNVSAVYQDNYQWQGVNTNANGNYLITVVPGRAFKVRTCTNCSGSPYGDQFYPGVYNLADANSSLTANFTLNQAALLQGFVRDGANNNPIGGLNVSVEDFNSGEFIASTDTAADGSYRLFLSPGAEVRLHTCSSCQGNNSFPYINQFYDHVVQWELASKLVMGDSGSQRTIDFLLGRAVTISGHVEDSVTHAPLANINVHAENFGDGKFMSGSNTDGNGNYTLYVAPDVPYRVATCANCGGMVYIDQFYPNVTRWDQAVPAIVPSGGSLTADFQLQPAAQIRGHVQESGTGIAIPNVNMQVFDFASNNFILSLNGDQNGDYALNLAPGDYILRTCTECTNASYVNQYYNHVLLQSQAEKITLTAAGQVFTANFDLVRGETISGHVEDSLTHQPVINLNVYVEDFQSGEFMAGVNTDAGGNYALTLAAGRDYRLIACGHCSNLPYADKFYNNADHRDQATPLNFSPGSGPLTVNFQLLPTATVSGHVQDPDGNPMQSVHIVANYFGSGQNFASADTDANGNYTLFVNPGENYAISACAICTHIPFIDQYYNATEDGAQAQVVNLAPAASLTANFTLARAAAISGHVQDQSVPPNPIAGIHIIAEDFHTNGWLYSTNTNSNGDYTLYVKPGRDVRVKTCANCNGSPYGDKFYNDVVQFGDAGMIHLPTYQDTVVANFNLEPAAILQGTVQENVPGTPPVPNIRLYMEDAGSGDWIGETSTDSQGHYSLYVPAGRSVRLKTCAGCNGRPGYIDRYFDNKAFWEQATPINVPPGGSFTANFFIDPAALVTGYVRDSVSGLPVANLQITAEDAQTGENLGGAGTDAAGYYQIAVPLGRNIRLHTCTDCSAQPYGNQYYPNVLYSFQAQLINLAAPSDTFVADFNLNPGARISGHVEDRLTHAPLAGIDMGAEYYAFNDQPAAHIRTDANGNYEFYVQPGVDLRLRADGVSGATPYITQFYSDTNRWDQALRVNLPAAGDSFSANFQLDAGAVIQGHILDGVSGLPLANVQLGFMNYANGSWVGGTRSNLDGSYSFVVQPGQDYALRTDFVNGEPYAGQYYDGALTRSQSQKITPANPGDVVTADLHLMPGARIYGRVVDSSTQAPVANLTVFARIQGDNLYTARTDVNGEYSLYVAPGQDYYVMACGNCGGQNYIDKYYDNVTFWGFATKINLPSAASSFRADFSMDIPAVISGTVLDKVSRQPVEIIISAFEYGSNRFITETGSDAAGSYSLRLPPGADYYLVTCRVCVGSNYADQYYPDALYQQGAQKISLPNPGDAFSANFELSLAAVVHGHIEDSVTHLPLANVPIDISEFATPWINYANIWTDVNGNYELSLMPGRDFRLHVCPGCNNLPYLEKFYNNVSQWDQAAPLNLAPGANLTADYQLDPAAVITGHVADSSTGLPIANLNLIAEDFNGGGNGYGVNTDQNGDYSLNVAPGHDYRIRTCTACNGLAGYADQFYHDALSAGGAQKISLANAGDSFTANFNLLPGAKVSGHVQDGESGLPLANVNLTLEDPTHGYVSNTNTDANGNYVLYLLPGQDYRLHTCTECNGPSPYGNKYYNDAAFDAQAQLIHLPAAGSELVANFNLYKGAKISGRVTDSLTGEPVGNLLLTLNDYDHGWLYQPVWTDANGDYTVYALPGHDFRLGTCVKCFVDHPYIDKVYNDTDQTQNATRIHLASSAESLTADFHLDKAGVLKGRVVDPGGNPLSGIHIQVNHPDGNYAAEGNTGPDGVYAIDLKPGTYILQTWGDEPNPTYGDFGPAHPYFNKYYPDTLSSKTAEQLLVTAGATHNLADLTLQPAAQISGKVKDYGGNPVAGAGVFANDGLNWAYLGHTDAQGDFLLNLAPGQHYFIGTTPENSGNPGLIYELYMDTLDRNLAIDLLAGPAGSSQAGFDFVLPQAGFISGTVRDAAGQPLANVFLLAYDSSGYEFMGWALSAADGSYQMSVKPGQHRIVSCGYCGQQHLLNQYYDRKYTMQEGTLVAVAAGATTGSIDFSLGGAGLLKGFVRDTLGDPLMNATVYAISVSDPAKVYRIINIEQNARDGSYILPVPAGEYRLVAESHGYLAEWYSEQASPGGATVVSIADGAEVSGLNFSLVASTIPDQNTGEESLYSYTLDGKAFNDVTANDAAVYQASLSNGSVLPAWLSFDPATLTFSGTPQHGDVGSLTILVTARYHTFTLQKSFQLTVVHVNHNPTAIQLSASSIDENVLAGSLVGTFGASDPDAGQLFTYSLAPGEGSADNGSFTITAGSLTINASPDYESKNSYNIRVRVTDNGTPALWFEQAFVITINNLNEAPSALQLSASSIAENVAAGSAVGTFSIADPDSGQTFTYSLVSGTGGTDNAAFTILGDTLKINASPNFEAKSSYSIRVRSTDSGSPALWVEKAFTILILDVNEAPTALQLSPSSLNENVPAGSLVGTFSTSDPDTGQTFTYSLVTGTGSTDNASFSINGSILSINLSPNFESRSSYSIRVRSSDSGSPSQWLEKVFTITILDVNDAPTAIQLNPSSIDENAAAGSAIGNFGASDPDAGQTFTYSLVTGSGSADNGLFTITSGALKINVSPDYESKNSYSIRVRATDSGTPGLAVEQAFTIAVNNLNEPPTDILLSASYVGENAPAGSVVGSFNPLDPEAASQVFAYSLVNGTGSGDNASFQISADQLQIKVVPHYALKPVYSIRVRVTDSGSPALWYEKVFTIQVANTNSAPTNILFSQSSINENVSAGSAVGVFSAEDVNAGQVFSYSLVDGEGSTDNSTFSILSGGLKIESSPDYEAKNFYSIRVRVTDNGVPPLSYEKVFSIAINNLNEAPNGLFLSQTGIDEGSVANSTVAALSASDPDTGQTFTFSLVAGSGGADNAAFTVAGNLLKINDSPSYAAKPSYSIRLRVSDSGAPALGLEQVFTITVNRVNQPPTDLLLSSATVAEGVPAGHVIGTFSAQDADSGQAFAYSLVAGTGSSDNAAFTISGNELRIKASPDYAIKPSYAIRVRVTDSGYPAQSFEKAFVIAVTETTGNPSISSFSKSADQDTSIAFSALDFSGHFVKLGGTDLESVEIVVLPAHGALKLSGAPLLAGAQIPAASLDALVYEPLAGYSGSDQFSWNAANNIGYAVANAQVNLTLNFVAHFALEANPASDAKLGLAGSTVNYTFVLTNRGNTQDSFSLSLQPGSAWTVTPSPLSVSTMNPGASAFISAAVSIPAGATGGQSDVAVLRIASNGDPGHYLDVTLTTTATLPPPPPAPVVSGVFPASGRTSQSTALTLSGYNFSGTPLVWLGSTQIGLVSRMSSVALSVLIPAGMATGVYDLRVCNPDGQCAALPEAFTVLNDSPQPAGLTPNQGYNDAANEVLVEGFNFSAQTLFSLGSLPLATAATPSANQARVIIPAGLLPGTYLLRACNGAQCGLLAGAYTVLDAVQNDFSITSADLWSSPLTIREGNTVTLGVNVHRSSGVGFQQADVAFFLGDPAAGGVQIGPAVHPRTPPMAAGDIEALTIDWTPSGISGAVPIYVVVDPDVQLSEASRANNTATALFVILPREQKDETPPLISALTIDGGAAQTTVRTVSLAIAAQDNPGGSGVKSMYLVEREYNTSARQWVAVQESGWIPFQASSNFTLSDHSGLHYIQVWVSDGAGNISTPLQEMINYEPPSAAVMAGQVRIYRLSLAAGETRHIRLDVLSGDADLYVWDPNGIQVGGNQVGYSVNSGLAPDEVTFTAAMAGDYQVEVYGYLDSTYQITFSAASGTTLSASSAGIAPLALSAGKAERTAPAVVTSGEPPVTAVLPPAPQFYKMFLYLPNIHR